MNTLAQKLQGNFFPFRGELEETAEEGSAAVGDDVVSGQYTFVSIFNRLVSLVVDDGFPETVGAPVVDSENSFPSSPQSGTLI